jgi:hypothetical protein
MTQERRMHGKIGRIDRAEYASDQTALKHLFVVGDLRREVPHPFFRDQRVEIILCNYEAGDDGQYHWHPGVTEYELILCGEVGYFEVATGVTHWFEAGDLCTIPPGACVKRLVRNPAQTVAIKVPSTNDKFFCDACDRDCHWRVKPHRSV